MKKINNDGSSDLCSITVNFHKVKKKVAEDWIKQIIYTILESEKIFHQGDISVVLVSDEYITRLNKKFLYRDRPTDVLVFPLEEDDLWGEIYISMDRAEEQSTFYQVNFCQELARLVIHGILHLLGYDDQHAKARYIMHSKEEYYLQKLNIK